MKKIKYIVIGIVIATILSSMFVCASSNMIEVLFDNIKIKINGIEIKADTEPFIYKDRTYVPLRAVAENMGAFVEWDGTKNTVLITEPDNETTSNLYDSIYLLGTFSRINEISENLVLCREILIYESRDSYVYDRYYESFKVNRDSFNDLKSEYINIAKSIISNSDCHENIEVAHKLLNSINLLDDNINLLSDLYVTYDSNKDKKISDNRYSIVVNNVDARNMIYKYINE